MIKYNHNPIHDNQVRPSNTANGCSFLYLLTHLNDCVLPQATLWTYHLILLALLAASASLRHLCLLSRLCLGFPFIRFSLIYYACFQPLISSWQWMLCFSSFHINWEAEDAGTTLIPLTLHYISRYSAIVDISFISLVSPSESLWSSDKIKTQMYQDSHKECTYLP